MGSCWQHKEMGLYFWVQGNSPSEEGQGGCPLWVSQRLVFTPPPPLSLYYNLGHHHLNTLGNVFMGLFSGGLLSTAETGQVRLQCWWSRPGSLQTSPCQRPELGRGRGVLFHACKLRLPDSVSCPSRIFYQESCHIHLTKLHIDTFQQCRGQKRQGKMGKVLETEGRWSGSWSRRRTLGGN